MGATGATGDMAASLKTRFRFGGQHVRQLAWLGLLAVVTAVIAQACFRGEWEFYVQNQSDREWLVRVLIGGGYGDQHWVTVVPVGSAGVGAEWIGEKDRVIELLDGECNVVGVFRTSDGTSYAVEGVGGVEGTVDPWGTHLGEKSGPSMSHTGKCGGTTLM